MKSSRYIRYLDSCVDLLIDRIIRDPNLVGLILQSMEYLHRPRIRDRRATRCVCARAAPAQCRSENMPNHHHIRPRTRPTAAPVPNTLCVLPGIADTRAGEGDRSVR